MKDRETSICISYVVRHYFLCLCQSLKLNLHLFHILQYYCHVQRFFQRFFGLCSEFLFPLKDRKRHLSTCAMYSVVPTKCDCFCFCFRLGSFSTCMVKESQRDLHALEQIVHDGRAFTAAPLNVEEHCNLGRSCFNVMLRSFIIRSQEV